MREIERLDLEIEKLRDLLYQPCKDIEETHNRIRTLRELGRRRQELRKRNRPVLKPLPPLSFDLEKTADDKPKKFKRFKAIRDDSRRNSMTYEQMEKTMQFILDQQAAMTTRQAEFEEGRKQLAAENAERDKRFEEWRTQTAIEFEVQLKRVTATFAEQNGKIYEMMERTHTDLATLSADALFFRDTGDDHEKRINELHDGLNTLVKQVTSLSAKVEELAETVRKLIKGGSNGWPRN